MAIDVLCSARRRPHVGMFGDELFAKPLAATVAIRPPQGRALMPVQISRRTLVSGVGGILAATALPETSLSQDYPVRDISCVIGYAPGGMSDNISRILGEKLAKATGRSVINDYRAGAGGAIAANYYLGTKPDGHTLLVSTNGFYAIIPRVTKVEYNPTTDFTPLIALEAPMLIAANPSVKANSLQEFIKYAKDRPGKIAYGSAGRGSVGHMCGEWLSRKTGTQLLHIPYNGTPQAMQAGVSNEVQLVFGPEALEMIAVKKLNGLAALASKRWDKAPDIPTIAECGFPGWAPRSWHTITILNKAPDAIKVRLNKLFNEFLQLPDVRERIANIGLVPALEDLATIRKRADDDITEYGQLIADAGLGFAK
jgi:tripartite-type tricarboxylate transporter receptor subunit TctC